MLFEALCGQFLSNILGLALRRSSTYLSAADYLLPNPSLKREPTNQKIDVPKEFPTDAVMTRAFLSWKQASICMTPNLMSCEKSDRTEPNPRCLFLAGVGIGCSVSWRNRTVSWQRHCTEHGRCPSNIAWKQSCPSCLSLSQPCHPELVRETLRTGQTHLRVNSTEHFFQDDVCLWGQPNNLFWFCILILRPRPRETETNLTCLSCQLFSILRSSCQNWGSIGKGPSMNASTWSWPPWWQRWLWGWSLERNRLGKKWKRGSVAHARGQGEAATFVH